LAGEVGHSGLCMCACGGGCKKSVKRMSKECQKNVRRMTQNIGREFANGKWYISILYETR
jgi:hypothetical protein